VVMEGKSIGLETKIKTSKEELHDLENQDAS
jgi:hypothetical protein